MQTAPLTMVGRYEERARGDVGVDGRQGRVRARVLTRADGIGELAASRADNAGSGRVGELETQHCGGGRAIEGSNERRGRWMAGGARAAAAADKNLASRRVKGSREGQHCSSRQDSQRQRDQRAAHCRTRAAQQALGRGRARGHAIELAARKQNPHACAAAESHGKNSRCAWMQPLP